MITMTTNDINGYSSEQILEKWLEFVRVCTPDERRILLAIAVAFITAKYRDTLALDDENVEP